MSDNEFIQTWWDQNLGERFPEFASWVGNSDVLSKKMFRDYVKDKGYTSLLDLGCGNATEFFAYKEEYPELKYIGVDSSVFLFKRNKELGVPMLLIKNDKVPLLRNYIDVVFSRHVLEHQPSFRPLLSEMIRLACKEVINVFFIAPKDVEIIHYNEEDNLYHNTFCRDEIEDYLRNHPEVETFTWIPITFTEIGLSIIKKEDFV